MLFTEDLMELFPIFVVFLLDFHKVTSPSRTFYMERNLTFTILALHTSTLFLKTNNTNQIKSFLFHLIRKLYWCFWCYGGSWNPRSTTKMYPFVFSKSFLTILDKFFISMEKYCVVLRYLIKFLLSFVL